ncbi:hypothetical protein DP939_25035 [Spongiactinospora rosea]|uniref:Uncharacterized protein n=1 Tax=Spongiactinospora rosea TaxID=2248750 RepID=A0A366LTD9_9ACTN|nr:hypothetical protein [Spongiactinospora rosea]RBQ17215.1 hypothetical protein DP939_25035 [Spongiactinospora rosea]
MERAARAVADGTTSPECAPLPGAYSAGFLRTVDAALAGFEAEAQALVAPSDEQVFAVIERVVLALNEAMEDSEGGTIDTDEREQLCLYIDEVLTRSGVDVGEVAARHGMRRYAITDRWRQW